MTQQGRSGGAERGQILTPMGISGSRGCARDCVARAARFHWKNLTAVGAIGAVLFPPFLAFTQNTSGFIISYCSTVQTGQGLIIPDPEKYQQAKD